MSPAVLSSPDSVTTARIISPLLDRKIDETAAGLAASIAKSLHSIGEKNAAVIIEYIAAMKSEINLSDLYRRDLIVVLCKFSKYNDSKPFKESIRTDILAFLDSFRKTEAQDPLHKWIGTLSGKEENDKKSKEPDYDEDKYQLEEEQEEETGETTNQVF